MWRFRALLVLAIGAADGLAMRVAGDVVTLYPARDATLYEDAAGALANGAGTAMFAGRNSQTVASIRRAILAFDIAAAIPASSTIEYVSLSLFNDAANAGPAMVELRRATADWGEGSSVAPGSQGGGGPAAAGDVTWTYRFYNSTLWATPGGESEPTVSTAAVVSGPGRYTWDSTPLFVADVQRYLDDSDANFGWLLLGDESVTNTAKRFATREAADPSLRPTLTIEFTPVPEAGTAFAVLIALLIVCRNRHWPGWQ
jgi:hypothetical protein